jgi:hypothetical protein
VPLLPFVSTAIPAIFKTTQERLLVRVGSLACLGSLAHPRQLAEATRRLVRTHCPVLGDRPELDLGGLIA